MPTLPRAPGLLPAVRGLLFALPWSPPGPPASSAATATEERSQFVDLPQNAESPHGQAREHEARAEPGHHGASLPTALSPLFLTKTIRPAAIRQSQVISH